MADAAVFGILMVSMGFVMWVGHLLAKVVSGTGERSEGNQ